MTIVIGIKCDQAIILACDSRTTDELGYSHDNAVKLHEITFQDGNIGIVAEAGHAELSSQAVEIMSRFAAQKPLADYRGFANCAVQAISELKQQLRLQFNGTAEELQKHFESHSFELMLANYFNGKPYIFTIRFELGLATKIDGNYRAIGCGAILADFLLSRVDFSKFSHNQSLWSALYAIEEIKQIDQRCGGPSLGAVLTRGSHEEADSFGFVLNSSNSQFRTLTDAASEFSTTTKANWKETVEGRMAEILAKQLHNRRRR